MILCVTCGAPTGPERSADTHNVVNLKKKNRKNTIISRLFPHMERQKTDDCEMYLGFFVFFYADMTLRMNF